MPAVRVLLAALAAISLFATSAGAWSVDLESDEYDHITFVEQPVWFTGSLPLGNVNSLTADPITWSTDEPTGDQPSVNYMNNYSTFVDLLGGNSRAWNTFTVEGTFTGYLDTIAVTLYADANLGTVCGFDALAFDLAIDGDTFLFQDQATPSANLNSFVDGDHIVVTFIFTRLFELAEELGLEGDEDTEHTISLNMANFYACNEQVLYYDAETTPAGMVFNMDPDGNAARFFTEIDVYNPPPPLEG